MNRRQWIRSSALTTGSIWFSSSQFNQPLAASARQQPADIREVHIIHLSHHDYGYTDLPSSVWDYQVNNTKLALQYIEETADYPDESRFRWTEEGLWGVERFWQEASEMERQQFTSFVKSGFIEVTAMPGNMTCLMDRYEWENELDRLTPYFDMFRPRVALQDDVNGLPWGLVDSLLSRDVKWITMASNDFLGGPPLPKPSFFWWQGQSGKKMLMFNGRGYADGYFYFHDKEWRKGPVPHRHDIWFNDPSGNEIFSTEPGSLQKSHKILRDKIKTLLNRGYSHNILPLSVTNMWTIDNDVPCRQLTEFIKEWNQAGLEPKLVFSTPSMFIEKFLKDLPEDLPLLKGEWCDWWANGIANSPFEVSVLQAAKRRNADIGRLLNYFDADGSETIKKRLGELNRDLVFCSEHTWGAYDSIARPYSERTKGNHHQKFDYFFRCDENSRRIKSEVIRNSSFYKPLSQTSFIEVINPGSRPRSGWVDISAVALRQAANAVKDLTTGDILPFESTVGSDWIPVEEGIKEKVEDIPNDVWPFRKAQHRFHLPDLQPQEKKRFEFVRDSKASIRKPSQSKFYEPVFDKKTGALKNIVVRAVDKPLFNGDLRILVERPVGKYIRDDINAFKADAKSFRYSYPIIKAIRPIDSVYSMGQSIELEELFAKKITQEIHFFDSIPRIEITTTIWLKENANPIAVYLGFPFSLKNSSAFYNSMGVRVQVGVDQLPNTCGIYNTVQEGVIFKGEEMNIALTTLDAPIGIFEKIQRHKKRVVFKPQTAHFYSLLCENYWTTNFAALQPSKTIFHHVIECFDKNTEPRLVENNELWAYPVHHRI